MHASHSAIVCFHPYNHRLRQNTASRPASQMLRHVVLRACTDLLRRSAKVALTRNHLSYVCVLKSLRAWATGSEECEQWHRKLHITQYRDDGAVPSQSQLAGRRLSLFMLRVAIEIEATDSEERKEVCLRLFDRAIEYLEKCCEDPTIKKELLDAFPETHEQTYINENIAYVCPLTGCLAPFTSRMRVLSTHRANPPHTMGSLLQHGVGLAAYRFRSRAHECI